MLLLKRTPPACPLVSASFRHHESRRGEQRWSSSPEPSLRGPGRGEHPRLQAPQLHTHILDTYKNKGNTQLEKHIASTRRSPHLSGCYGAIDTALKPVSPPTHSPDSSGVRTEQSTPVNSEVAARRQENRTEHESRTEEEITEGRWR